MPDIKHLVWSFISRYGRRIRDERTGQWLGRAYFGNWFGRVWLVGLHRPYVRPVFLAERKLRYARHRLGFETPEPVDFPSLSTGTNVTTGKDILYAMLFHGTEKECRVILQYWQTKDISKENILIVYGGSETNYNALTHSQKVFVSDDTLRTKHHPLERQSYAGPFREVSRWLGSRRNFEYVCLVEYDHLPLVHKWGHKLLQKLSEEKADVLFHHLTRVDGTNAPHYLNHLSDPDFAGAWKASSVREDKGVVLNCIATGSFWKRNAFDAVAKTPEHLPIYQEMYLPTQAHHLGFRVRGYGEQDRYVDFNPLSAASIKQATMSTAWSLHPVKDVASLESWSKR